MKQRFGKVHCIIPDVQDRPGVPMKHLKWIGQYIADKRPDVIVCLGDFADMPSFSSYAVGKVEAEGKRYVKDIAHAREAMATLVKPFTGIKGYKPRMILTLGNHEDRIDREAEANPKLHGLISTDDLKYEEFAWKVYPFLKIVRVHGVEYTHYFTSGVKGNPVGKAVTILNTRHCSGVMGHVQTTDMSFHQKTGHVAIMAGVCNLHDEKYLGNQGNTYRRQIVMLHEVRNGIADPMFVSLRFLKARYS